MLSEGGTMENHRFSLEKHLKIVPAALSDYRQMSCFHYCPDAAGPVRVLYKIIDDHLQALDTGQRALIDSEMRRFLEKFTSQRNRPDSLERTGFVLSRLTARPVYYLWRNPDKNIDFSLSDSTEPQYSK
jgi:hypothetical protein